MVGIYTDKKINDELSQDQSSTRFEQLLGRYETKASNYYADFQKSEIALMNQPIKTMSKLTQGILQSLDYSKISLIRQRNFWALHSQLGGQNLFKNLELIKFTPMLYPFWTKNTSLRQLLIEQKIYVAKYWPEALDRTFGAEENLVNEFLYLSIDQRLDIESIKTILDKVSHG